MARKLVVTIPGPPVPKGSLRRSGRSLFWPPRVRQAQALATKHLQREARRTRWRCTAAPVAVTVAFCRTPSRRGDLDKLCRLLLDAATGVVYQDDAQVVAINAVIVTVEDTPDEHTRVSFEPVSRP